MDEDRFTLTNWSIRPRGDAAHNATPEAVASRLAELPGTSVSIVADFMPDLPRVTVLDSKGKPVL